MITLSQKFRAYSIPYSYRMIIFCFITTIKLFTLLLYHLHVSLGLQLIKKEDRGFKCKKKHYNRAFYWRKQKHSMQNPCWTGLLTFTNWDQLKIKEQSEWISCECWLSNNAVMTGVSLEGTMSPGAPAH